MKDLYLETDDDFENAICVPYWGKRCRDKRAEAKRQEEAKKEQDRINKIGGLTRAIKFDPYFESITSFASAINNPKYSLTDLKNLRARGLQLYNFYYLKDSDKFGTQSPASARGQNIKKFVKARQDILNIRIKKIEEEKKLESEREANRKKLFGELFSKHGWITRALNSSVLTKLTDFQIEEALNDAEEYLLFEKDSGVIKEYEGKIQSLIAEQQKRLNPIIEEEEQIEKEESNGADTSSEGGSAVKNALMKYKWYIGGALVLGVVGIVVIRKI